MLFPGVFEGCSYWLKQILKLMALGPVMTSREIFFSVFFHAVLKYCVCVVGTCDGLLYHILRVIN